MPLTSKSYFLDLLSLLKFGIKCSCENCVKSLKLDNKLAYDDLNNLVPGGV